MFFSKLISVKFKFMHTVYNCSENVLGELLQ
jgi:hypothetical protein